MLETVDDAGLTAAVLAVSLAVIGLAALMQRRQRKRHLPAGWVPWNGLLFLAIVVAAISLAHLLGVRQR